MTFEKLKPYFKWGIYYLLLLLFFALQTTPNLLEIFGIKPILIVPLMVSVCMFEGIMKSAVFSMVTGLLWDVSSDKLLGFNGIILLCFGTIVVLLCVYYLHTKLLNSIIFCALVLLFEGLLDYVFHFAMWNIPHAITVFTTSILPTMTYSVLFAVPSYFLVRQISQQFNDVTRI